MNKRVISLIVLVSLLSACGPTAPVQPTMGVNDIQTAAALTVIAEFTQTAQAMPTKAAATATNIVTVTPETPQATATPTGPANTAGVTATPITCDNSNFDSATVDVTYPDGTEVKPGQDFVKTWKIKNTGTCIWGTDYAVIFAYGEKMAGIAEPLTVAVGPGEEVEISVRFQAPNNAGQYSSYWRMANANNIPFGQTFYVQIVVR